jgi:hypothetical protein
MNSLTSFAGATRALLIVVFAVVGLSRSVQAQNSGTFSLITPNFDVNLLQSVSFTYTLSQGVNATTYNFKIANTSTNSLSTWVDGTQPTITDIYFDDSSLNLLNSPTIVGAGTAPPDNSVSYSVGAPGSGNLPGGNNVGFDESYLFSTNPPPSKNGIDPGEFLTVSFQSSQGYAAILGALNTGDLRIGMHVQEIGTEGASAAFVSTGTLDPGTQAVPEPGSALLVGVVGVILLVRRRRNLP